MRLAVLALAPAAGLVLSLAVIGCNCARVADQEQLGRYGGRWIGGGPFSSCAAEWLWFEPKDHQITDDDLAALVPAVKRLHPKVLQLYGQRQISDHSISSINQIESVRTVLVADTGITTAGLRQLRAGIEASDAPGYTVHFAEPRASTPTSRLSIPIPGGANDPPSVQLRVGGCCSCSSCASRRIEVKSSASTLAANWQ